MVTNTPGVLTDTVAEHTFALMLAIAHRIAEADRFVRAGKYTAWGPELLLGTDLSNKTLGVLGLGRIGSRVAFHAAKGFGMKVLYYDPNRNPEFEKEYKVIHKMCQVTASMIWAIPLVPGCALGGWFFGWTLPITAPVGIAALAFAGGKHLLEGRGDVKNQ